MNKVLAYSSGEQSFLPIVLGQFLPNTYTFQAYAWPMIAVSFEQFCLLRYAHIKDFF
jgi:hypothetical protein